MISTNIRIICLSYRSLIWMSSSALTSVKTCPCLCLQIVSTLHLQNSALINSWYPQRAEAMNTSTNAHCGKSALVCLDLSTVLFCLMILTCVVRNYEKLLRKIYLLHISLEQNRLQSCVKSPICQFFCKPVNTAVFVHQSQGSHSITSIYLLLFSVSFLFP